MIDRLSFGESSIYAILAKHETTKHLNSLIFAKSQGTLVERVYWNYSEGTLNFFNKTFMTSTSEFIGLGGIINSI